MSWTKLAVINDANAVNLISKSVRMRRALGFKTEHALEDTAVALGATPRRIRSILRGEVPRISEEEHRRLLSRWHIDIDRQAERLITAANRMRTEAESEWMAEYQLSLPFGAQRSVSDGLTSAFGVGAQQFRGAT